MSGAEKKLLIVEDDPGLQSQLRWSFEDYEVSVAEDRESAIAQLRRTEPAVVTLDLGLPPDPGGVSEGFATLETILSLAPGTKVIVVTGHNDRNNAVRAIGMGAYDFYEKPIDPDLLSLVVERATRLYNLEQENRRLATSMSSSPLEGIIAASPQMLRVCRTVEKLAPTDVSTLILGESGTGKEAIVKALHSLSARAERRLVAINCAAIPENLLESELFGYEKGAFTGATRTTPGKIETAEGGVLFLDEVGDLPLALQAKLLRFLQERVIERVGGRREIPVDVRVVCATHRDLRQMIAEQTFREDLYYRINEATINIPPLRERDGDVVLLARWFLQRFATQLKRPVKGFSQRALEVLEAYDWPGNVRELENRIKRAVIMADGPQVTEQDLELETQETEQEPFNLREVREQAEYRAVLRALSFSENNVSHTAEMLGITRPTLYNLLKKYNITI
ncbi:MAG TPA: PEP-CTERM-box response regulator transcription factor [Sedimenticola thiotaurini]|uniref:PEP-CTERM-box response regulator transcription factor n=1 Tax=Sedimenticola thiotaurini TaxID=1543721 RepID=A0A831RNM9_9GAMM|nr:PEP-CTERM-box response regulator transcription factor [Sedimenticola thiotaurini]